MHARARPAFRARGDITFDRGRRDEHATSLGGAIHGVGGVLFEKHQMVLFDEGWVERGDGFGGDVAAAPEAGFRLERVFEARWMGN